VGVTTALVKPTVAGATLAEPDKADLQSESNETGIETIGETLPPDLLKAMKTPALEKHCANKYEEGQKVSHELYLALLELQSRCKTEKIWQKSLLRCGIKPGTWRSWHCRELNQLTTGKRTGSRHEDKPKPKRKPINIDGDPRTETEAQELAKAGVQLAGILLDDKTEPEVRGQKAADFAGELIEAVEGTDYSLIPQPTGEYLTPEEIAAVRWCLRIMSTYIGNNLVTPQVEEARGYALTMRRILEVTLRVPPPEDDDPEPPQDEADPMDRMEISSESNSETEPVETPAPARKFSGTEIDLSAGLGTATYDDGTREPDHVGDVNYWTNVAKKKKAAEKKAKKEQEAWLRQKKAEAEAPKPEPPVATAEAPAQTEEAGTARSQAACAPDAPRQYAYAATEMDEEDIL
jgi:hypothetical protein